MGDPQPLSVPGGDSYRFEKYSGFFCWAYLAFAAGVGLVYPPAAFALLPFVFLFTRLNTYRFLVLWIASTLFFFETYRSSFHFLAVSDALPLVFGFLLLLYAFPKGFVFRVPMNAAFFAFYLFLLLGLALLPKAMSGNPTLYWVFDSKILALLAFVPVLVAAESRERSPKKIFLLLGTVILFSSLHAIELMAHFAGGNLRPFTWTGIFLGSSVIFCVILLRLPFSKTTRWQLRIGLTLCTLGVLVSQTRGIWLSTLACLGLLFLANLLAMRGRALGFLLRFLLIGSLVFLIANFAFAALAGRSMVSFILLRLSDLEWVGLLDPYSSTGYRVHEAWAIWDERTFWGHGPGATINLFFTQMNRSEFLDWWSIHSGYFEILHKYGFAGLFTLAFMFVALCIRALRMIRRGNQWETAAGAAALLMLLNHAIFSLSSNEFTRPNSPIMWFLAFYLTTNLAPRDRARTDKPAAP